MSSRSLRLTLYDPVRRQLRRGHWQRWQLLIVHDTSGLEWHSPFARGWTKSHPGAVYSEFNFGVETDVSRCILAARWGVGLEDVAELQPQETT